MILVDTSVVIAYLRSGDPALIAIFAANGAAICGVTRAEVLHGVRNQTERANLVAALDSFHQVSISEVVWDEIGDCLAALRTAGLPMPLADVVVAVVAMHHGLELWSHDQHHIAMQAVVPALKLFQASP